VLYIRGAINAALCRLHIYNEIANTEPALVILKIEISSSLYTCNHGAAWWMYAAQKKIL
jgi:hypothetical protein